MSSQAETDRPQEFQSRAGSQKSVAVELMREDFTQDEIDGLPGWRGVVFSFVFSKVFEFVTALLIMLNSLVIGLELNHQASGAGDLAWAKPLEHVFLALYIVELSLRLFAMQRHALNDNWIKFDCVLVALGASTLWVLGPIVADDGDGGNSGNGAVLTVLRMARFLRILRTLRVVGKFRQLGILVESFLATAPTTCYALVLLVMFFYIFACLGMSMMIGHPLHSGSEVDPVFRDIVDQHFRSVPIAMMTLMQFACLDSVAAIYKPLVERDTSLGFYFGFVKLIISIVLMNLIAATVVNVAIEQAADDKERIRSDQRSNKDFFLSHLRDIFRRVDMDDSGSISRHEIEKLSYSDLKYLRTELNVGNPGEIFEVIDIDGSDSVTMDEFLEGVWSVATCTESIEFKKLSQKLIALASKVDGELVGQSELMARLAAVHTLLLDAAPTLASSVVSDLNLVSPPTTRAVGKGLSLPDDAKLRSFAADLPREPPSSGLPRSACEDPQGRTFAVTLGRDVSVHCEVNARVSCSSDETRRYVEDTTWAFEAPGDAEALPLKPGSAKLGK